MKNGIIALAVLIAFLGAVFGFVCSNAIKCTPEPTIKYVPYGVTDSVAAKELILTKELLRRTKDSLEVYKADTNMTAELFIAKYKLERIRHYNEIAAKGNNIKYLRGWINRVLIGD